MASVQFLAVFLFSLSAFIGFSQGRDGFLIQGGYSDSVVGLQNEIPTCMQKILPCQQYIKSPTNPPPSCCLPLKQMLANDLECLCSVFNNQDLLKALNVTQSEALKLPQACGADVDMSTCKNAGATPPTDSTAAPPPPATASDGSTSSKRSSSTRNIPAYAIGYGFAAASLLVYVL